MTEAAAARAVRGGGAPARRDAHGAGGARAAAEDGVDRARRSRRLRRQARRQGRDRAGVPVPRRARRSSASSSSGTRKKAAPPRPRCSKRRCSSSMPTRRRRPRSTCRVPLAEQDLLEAWLAQKSDRKVAHHGAAARRQEGDDRAGAPQRRAGVSHALRRQRDGQLRGARDACRPRFACRGCRGGSSASTSRPSRAATRWPRWWCAKTGRMKPGEYRKFRVTENRNRGSLQVRLPGPKPHGSRGISSTISPPWSRSCAGVIARVLENGGPFPDLIVIDGGKGS